MEESPLSYEYSLYCILIHKGMQSIVGHYFVYVKDLNNNWILVNDLPPNIKKIKLEDVLYNSEIETPYMLFYIRDAPNDI